MDNKKAKQIVDHLLDEFERVRKEKGLSHEKLAKLAGVHRSSISLIESKKRTPTILTCVKIADALDLSLADIIE